MISAIAAIGQNRELGKDNKLLWHIPEDFKRFKTLTSGHPIIMGRKTYESIGRLLPNRTNIIVTRDMSYIVSGAIIVHSFIEAIEQAKKAVGSEEIFIIGGGQIFTEAIEKGLIDRLYLTIVHKTFEADAFFPVYAQFTHELEKEDYATEDLSYTFLTLEK